MFGRLKESFAVRMERDQIIKELQDGTFTVTQTMRRLAEHAKRGGRERVHVWSCRIGSVACNCPYKFDHDPRDLVPLESAYKFAEEVLQEQSRGV